MWVCSREVSKDVGAAFEELQQTTALVASFEAMMHERLDPLTMHLTGMKRRMLSAQEEATSLRSELATAQQRCTQLQVRASTATLPHCPIAHREFCPSRRAGAAGGAADAEPGDGRPAQRARHRTHSRILARRAAAACPWSPDRKP